MSKRRRSIAADPENGYAYSSLAYHKIARGEFSEALELVSRALAAAPDNQVFQQHEESALLALGRYGELRRRNLERAAAWYAEVLGLEGIRRHGSVCQVPRIRYFLMQ